MARSDYEDIQALQAAVHRLRLSLEANDTKKLVIASVFLNEAGAILREIVPDDEERQRTLLQAVELVLHGSFGED